MPMFRETHVHTLANASALIETGNPKAAMLICYSADEAFHFLMTRRELEQLGNQIIDALTKAPLPTRRP